MLPGLAPSLSEYFYKDRGADKKQLECRPSMEARVRGGGGGELGAEKRNGMSHFGCILEWCFPEDIVGERVRGPLL